MKTNAKIRKVRWYASLIAVVVVLATLYFFWEHYLFHHYLGGFTHEGYLVQRSETGLLFFLTTWPLWVFPLVTGIGLTLLWHQSTLNQARQRIERLEEERITLQAALHDAEAKQRLSNKNHHTDAPNPLPESHKDYDALIAAHETLQKDYQASLDFIEKLLLRLNGSE